MLGIVVLAAFELFGVLQAWRLFSRRGRTVRLWLGMVMGLMEMMWLPSLFAFALDFTLPAQRLALLFPHRYEMTIHSMSGYGTCVTMIFPRVRSRNLFSNKGETIPNENPVSR